MLRDLWSRLFGTGGALERAPEEGEQPRLVAPHGLRALAWLIDFVFVAVWVHVTPSIDHSAVFVLALLVAYHTVLIWLVQQTVGKALLGLRVERLAGKVGFLWALGRASVGYCAIDLMGIGIAAALFNRDHRCFHDYVFGSVVIFQGEERMTLRVLLSRLVEWTKRQQTAEKGTTVATVGLIWTFMGKLARALAQLLDWARGTAPKVQGGAASMSVKTAAVLSIFAAASTAAAASYVPPVRQVADWLLTPHVRTRPPDGWGICECPDAHPFIGVIYEGKRWHQGGYNCPER